MAASSLTLNLLDVDEETSEPTTLGGLRAGGKLVLDFWHTRCTNCPQALSKLDAVATKHKDVSFVACALSLGSETEGRQEDVMELLQDMWPNLKHCYMSFD